MSTLSACKHIDSIIAKTNKRLYLLNHLRGQGLSITGLPTAFLTFVIVAFNGAYALSAIGEFLNADAFSRINAVFVKPPKSRLTTTAPTASDKGDKKLIKTALDVVYCLHSIYCLRYATASVEASEEEEITLCRP